MKIVIVVFFIFSFQMTFSQAWEKIVVDEHVSITLPGPVSKEAIGDKIKISATTPLGYVTIERTKHPDSTSVEIDHLKFYADGMVFGMKASQPPIEVIENSDVLINKVKLRSILFRTSNGRLNQLYLAIVNGRIYHINYQEYTAPSEEERKKIFNSIEIK